MKTIICGAAGRMGQSLIDSILNSKQERLAGAIVAQDSPLIGSNVSNNTSVKFSSDLTAIIADCDAVIDFTTPDASLANLAICVKQQKPIVIGTTGFTANQLEQMQVISKQIPIVFAANFSIGINLLLQLVADAAKVLAASDFDIEVIEAHHRHKVDAPSGTALKIGEVLAQNLQRNLDDCAIYERYGQIGARSTNKIGFSTIRGGDIVGEHTVLFAGLGERLELTHKASSRQTFAQGAIRAAHWLQDKKAGLYDMSDVIKTC